MPICEADPWRRQYFDGVPCPDHVRVPTEDADAWLWNPQARWVYDKLKVAESQGFACGPHGVVPPAFPVFSKPVFNLRGMGSGSRVLRDRADYERHNRPGHIWTPYFEGEHVSTDAAVTGGVVRWWRHAVGRPLPGGAFDRWTVLAEPRPDIEAYCGAWLARHLASYNGMINFETIDARIIEVHLRFSDQWPDLYGGRSWVEALVRLYTDGVWEFDDGGRRDGHSVVLFGRHGLAYRHPPADLAAAVRAMPGVSSLQITFHADRPPSWHAMPPGGFRLAVVNGFDLEAGLAARALLAEAFAAAAQPAAEA